MRLMKRKMKMKPSRTTIKQSPADQVGLRLSGENCGPGNLQPLQEPAALVTMATDTGNLQQSAGRNQQALFHSLDPVLMGGV